MKHNLQSLIKNIELATENNRPDEIRRLTSDLHASTVADLLEATPMAEREQLWQSLDAERQGEILLDITSGDLRRDLLRHTGPDDLLAAINRLSYDEQADLINDLPEERVARLLATMDESDRSQLQQALLYDKDTAGGIMHVDTITVRGDSTLKDARQILRSSDKVTPRLDRLFVVDEHGRYLGILRILSLLQTSSDTLVKDAMETDTPTIHHKMPAGEVARLFDDRELLRAPVVDDTDTLLGHIVVDNVIDVMRREAISIENNAALLPEDESLFSPVFLSTKKRGIWLAFNLITAFMASYIINLFATTLQAVITLAVLLPIVMSMGGVSGSQTLTLVVRGIATGQIGGSNSGQLLLKELSIGALSGILWAAAIGTLAVVWFEDIGIGLIIAGSIVATLCCASVTGVSIPFIMKKIGIDPALSGGVLLTTVTDVVGIFVFLGSATWFLL